MKRLHEVDIIRTIAITIVVLAHCFAIYTGAWTHPDSSFEIVYGYSIFTSLLQLFMIPPLVLVAGYAFNYSNQKKAQSLKQIIISKFKRLIIPSLLFGVAYILLFFKDSNSLQKINTLFNGAGHLWFLPMLFWNYLIGYFLIKINNLTFKTLLLVFLFIISYYSSAFIPNTIGISNALSFTVYFFIGIQLFEYREFIIRHLKLRCIFLGFSIFTIMFFSSRFDLLNLSQVESYVFVNAYGFISNNFISVGCVLFLYSLVLYFVEIKKIEPNSFL